MYERFYNLRERPFSLSPDPDYLFPSRVHQEALSYLRFGLEGHAGFIVITGDVGCGKTTLLQTVLGRLDQQTSVSRLVNTNLDARELIEAVMLDFGLDPGQGRSKPHLLRDLARFLVEQRNAGRLALLVIDEAQNLSPSALEEIRMLSNLETEKSKLIQIALIGQPNLRDVLARPEFQQLRQRVTVRYHLTPLEAAETAAYINHRLRRAAIGAPLEFPRDVTDLIHLRSKGVPRTINVIADAVLLFGYGEEQRTITVELTRKVLEEFEETGMLDAVPDAASAAPSPATAPGTGWLNSPPRQDAEVAAREERVAERERQLDEQQRILVDAYKALRSQRDSAEHTETQAAAPVAPAASLPAGPAAREAAMAAGPARTAARPALLSSGNTILRYAAPEPVRRRVEPVGVWTRVRRNLFGVA